MEIDLCHSVIIALYRWWL